MLKQNERLRTVVEGDRWRCVRCGSCCRGDFEKGWIDFIESVTDGDSPSGRCIHLNFVWKKNWCGIHQSRPNACRAFPFTLRRSEMGYYRLMIHVKCQGFGKGRMINIKNKIRECIRHGNRHFGRRWRVDLSNYDLDGGVVLIK